MHVIGADGCRGGWISASSDGVTVKLGFYGSLGELVADNPAADRIAVDIPMGLTQNKPRRCDMEARKLLGERRGSVFPAPDRRVLAAFAEGALSHQKISSLSKTLTGKGISIQTYNILDKIAEADALLTPPLQGFVSEVHPELLFLALAGHPMRHAKKKPEGFAERLELLKRYFPAFPVQSRSQARRMVASAQPDDVLDAAAAAASALRMVGGSAVRIPEAPEIDPRGLRMEMSF